MLRHSENALLSRCDAEICEIWDLSVIFMYVLRKKQGNVSMNPLNVIPALTITPLVHRGTGDGAVTT